MQNVQRKLEEGCYGFASLKETLLDYACGEEGWALLLQGAAGSGKSHVGRVLADALGRPFISIDLTGQSEADYLWGKRNRSGVLSRECSAHEGDLVLLFDQVDRCAEGGTLLPALVQLVENRCFFDEQKGERRTLARSILLFTAQDVEQVPDALLQRVLLQQLPSFSRSDKISIAQQHLIPQLLARHRVPPLNIRLPESALEMLIDRYTHEAGVHQLNIKLEQILRRALRLQPQHGELAVECGQLFSLLGAPLPEEYAPQHPDKMGVVFGTAWSEDGGCLLPIEATLLAGDGNLLTTGKLGETLKESIQVALAVAKEVVYPQGYDSDFFTSKDIYLHFPESSTPKDGPSAGLSILIALLSAILQQPVCSSWSLTGELTLKGRVLPIGGLREKLFALHQHGFSHFVVPESNQWEYQEIGPDLPALPQVHFVRTVQQCIAFFFPEKR